MKVDLLDGKGMVKHIFDYHFTFFIFHFPFLHFGWRFPVDGIARRVYKWAGSGSVTWDADHNSVGGGVIHRLLEGCCC